MVTRLVLEAATLDPARRALEVVERKGVGHPDSLCDAVAEAFSRGLARLYLARTGRILHHNVDKALLCAGSTSVGFGGGAWKTPITAVLGGRATKEVGGEALPIDEVARAAVREGLAAVPRLDADRVCVQTTVHPVAADLADLFEGAKAGPPASNDTSIGVGFAPHTATERVALEVETRLAESAARAHPAFGPDVKVMAVRHGDRLRLTVAVALVAEHVPDASAHARTVGAARDLAAEVAREHGFADVEVRVNAGDAPGRTPYLTLSGTSLESGDDGQVGRGNRVSGLITPMRPMTLEAFAGKNPLTHVGKLLSVGAGRLAEACAALPGVRAAECVLVSEIGRPVDEPQIAGVRLDAPEGRLADLRAAVEALLTRELAQIPDLWRTLVGERGGG